MYYFATKQIQNVLYTFIEIHKFKKLIVTVDNISDKLSVLSYSAKSV